MASPGVTLIFDAHPVEKVLGESADVLWAPVSYLLIDAMYHDSSPWAGVSFWGVDNDLFGAESSAVPPHWFFRNGLLDPRNHHCIFSQHCCDRVVFNNRDRNWIHAPTDTAPPYCTHRFWKDVCIMLTQ